MGATCSASVHANSWGSYASGEAHLYEAALRGDLLGVRAALDIGARPDQFRHTMVCISISSDQRVDVTTFDSDVWLITGRKDGQTAFQAACSCGHTQCAQVLADAGADTKLTQVIGRLPHELCAARCSVYT
jgi:hypothetical protein